MHALLVDLRLGALHEHDPVKASDLAGIDGLRVLIGGNALPVLVVLEVIGGVGGADAYEVGLAAVLAELARLVLLEGAHGLPDLLDRELLGGIEGRPRSRSARVLDAARPAHGIPRDPLDHGADLLAQELRGIRDDPVVSGQIEKVSDLHVSAVLLYGRLNIGLRKGLSGGGFSLCQPFCGLIGVK